MMLAEYYSQDFYKELPSKLNSDGVWIEYPSIKEEMKKELANPEITLEIGDTWFEPNKMKDWILLDPDITDKDLRPYYYASIVDKIYETAFDIMVAAGEAE